MKRVIIIISVFLCVSVKIHAQKEIYVGFSVLEQRFENYTFTDNGPLLEGVNDHSFWPEKDFEIFIGFKVYEKLYLELAGKRKKYWTGYAPKSEFFPENPDWNYVYNWAFNSFQIPFRLKYNIPVIWKISINPHLGASYGLITANGIQVDEIDERIMYNSITNLKSDYKSHFVLGHTGLEIEFRILKRHSLLINWGYYKGFTKLVDMKMSYYFKDQVQFNYNAEIVGKGDYHAFGLSYRFYIKTDIKKKSGKKR